MTNSEESGSSASSMGRVGRLLAGLRVVSLCTLLSRILGMVREIAMAAVFGAGSVLDAFTTAFAIPNLARALFGEGALSTAFQPLFIRERERNGLDAANRLASAIFVGVSLGLLALVAVLELLLAGVLWAIPFDGITRLCLTLTSVMLPYLVLICLTAQVGAVMNVQGHFTWPAFVPVLFNVCSLLAIGLVQSLNLDAETQAKWLAAAVLVTGIVQLLASWPFLRRAGFRFDRQWREAKPRIRELVQVMSPILLGLSVTQLNTLCDRVIAFGFSQPEPVVALDQNIQDQAVDAPLENNHAVTASEGDSRFAFQRPLPSGTASALNLGQRLYQFPLGLLGVALGTVIFPLLTRHAERGDKQHLNDDLSLGLRLVMVVGLPASAGLWLLAKPLAVVMFQRRQFTAEDAALTAQMIEAYGIGVWAFCGLLIVQRGFYAVGDRRTPLKIGLRIMLINLTLNLTLIWILGGRGLALSTSLCAMLQFGWSMALIQPHIGRWPWRQLSHYAMRALLATIVMVGVSWSVMNWLEASSRGRVTLIGGTVLAAMVVYAGMTKLLQLNEFWWLIRRPRMNTSAENTLPMPNDD